MSIIQAAKKATEQVTNIASPGKLDLIDVVKPRKPIAFVFKDDGLIPNHPAWPLVVYRGAVKLPEKFDPAAVMEALFEDNGWGSTWRNGIYCYAHYHSQIHEVLGVARGTAKVRFGGEGGKTLILKGGSVAVLPAGTGHQCIAASDDFLVVGAYPQSGTYDECTSKEQHDSAVLKIAKVKRPRNDPVYGANGPLLASWGN
ncbi:cupin [Mesorhizobium sp. 113-3-9]|uniref:cupin n=1 Tax=Mesorhizobium sp. 113-3-9 TaxID=2744517 RepID=UPI001926FDB8|nr:cupin [Mesorhizobium sp. 113-3-9]BCG88344.1 cupin [Mesorhizobium sp. 113-3-9]